VLNPSERQERAFLVGVEFRTKGPRGQDKAATSLRARRRLEIMPPAWLRRLRRCRRIPRTSAPKNRSTNCGRWRRARAPRIAGEFTQRKDRPDPATLIGKGKLEEIAGAAASVSADVILFDHDLSPSQQRNIERVVTRASSIARS
jgi:GTP-binding protein HflX